VLIDWAFVGIGALAEDAAVLVADAVLDFHVEPQRFDELYEVVRGATSTACAGPAGRERPSSSTWG
jgi:hypothetical protein